MKEFAAITPTRGNRPEMLDFCVWQIQNQLIKPAKHYIIDYPPKNKYFDIKERILNGIKQAKADGLEVAYIIEDDDYYPANYFQVMRLPDNYNFVGIDTTIYYHLFKAKHTIFEHTDRSSLFSTGFKISSLDNFYWNSVANNNPFIDIPLWTWANSPAFKTKWVNPQLMPLGIKHSLGICGGNYHVDTSIYNYEDTSYKWLSANVNSVAFDFYTKLIQKNKKK